MVQNIPCQFPETLLKLTATPWKKAEIRFQVFSEGTTNGKGEITYKDTRKYAYEKTYCDGHAAPSWANMPENQEDGDSGDEDGKKSDAYEEAAEQTREAVDGTGRGL